MDVKLQQALNRQFCYREERGHIIDKTSVDFYFDSHLGKKLKAGDICLFAYGMNEVLIIQHDEIEDFSRQFELEMLGKCIIDTMPETIFVRKKN